MKRKTITFMIALIIGMFILPVMNIIYNPSTLSQKQVRDKLLSLYNMDIVESGFGYIGYHLGVSIAPDQVYVGKNGWLFLGENYSKPISTKIEGLRDSNEQTIKKIADNINSWDVFFKEHGVKDFKIIIGPDKESVYHEYAPSWFKQDDHQILPALMQSNPKVYVNAYDPIMHVKRASRLPLYFKTDTHWNVYGGAVAFNELARRLKQDVPQMRFENAFTEPDFIIKKKSGGDLSRFLKISHLITDNEVDIASREINDMNITSVDYRSGKIISTGKFSPIEAPRKLTVYGSANALNNYKVLWLRDSFGTAMSPYMVRTFGNILQIHYGRITPGEVKNLVISYKPDFVFITGVERDALSKFYYTPM
ncbi:alginate O-acetyltransferase AlgX-related protein [Cronobacter dublinensis]